MKWITGILAMLVLCMAPAKAATIEFGVWYQFAFDVSQPEATGCTPELCFDLAAGAENAPAAPWMFTAPATGAALTVTDVNLYGDVFEVFENGASLGVTSMTVDSGGCGLDPDICADPLESEASRGVFLFTAGPHEFTINLVQTEFGQGTGYFRLDAAPIPEPGAVVLMAAGFAALLLRRRVWAK